MIIPALALLIAGVTIAAGIASGWYWREISPTWFPLASIIGVSGAVVSFPAVCGLCGGAL